jgi:hypothetical protein
LKDCLHKSFFAQVNIARITADGTEDGPASHFYADVTIKCVECETPFHFVGVNGGLSPREPRCDPFAVELRAPIKPGLLPLPLAENVYELPPEADVVIEGEQ